ncbi:unnamed protein product [Candida verbasci]|uniref:DNA-directed RNA polymerase III subunit RPC6 n=1 Tax=Candida verbasci TaxID=1227364 RepID=A0A9W4XNI3_9ASCO|nr:unnamed protein product [Candida verbasci]
MSISDQANLLHLKMRDLGNNKLFSQSELQNLLGTTTKESELMMYLQELMNKKLTKLSKQGDEIKFQAISSEDAAKVFSMNNDEAMIYEHIEASGREGIWTKTLKAKTNLHQHIVSKCLKSLESNRYIKAVKSVKYPTRKIYMLYNVQPSIDVTGGPWFTDSELDTEFIDTLVEVIWRFIANKTFPKSDDNNPVQTSYISQHPGVDLDDVTNMINQSKVSSIELGVSDIRSLCDVLIFDDKIEEITTGVFKATWQSVIEKGLNKDIKDLHIPRETMEYLLSNQSYSIFDYKSTIEDLNEESDLIYLDSWINE